MHRHLWPDLSDREGNNLATVFHTQKETSPPGGPSPALPSSVLARLPPGAGRISTHHSQPPVGVLGQQESYVVGGAFQDTTQTERGSTLERPLTQGIIVNEQQPADSRFWWGSRLVPKRIRGPELPMKRVRLGLLCTLCVTSLLGPSGLPHRVSPLQVHVRNLHESRGQWPGVRKCDDNHRVPCFADCTVRHRSRMSGSMRPMSFGTYAVHDTGQVFAVCAGKNSVLTLFHPNLSDKTSELQNWKLILTPFPGLSPLLGREQPTQGIPNHQAPGARNIIGANSILLVLKDARASVTAM